MSSPTDPQQSDASNYNVEDIRDWKYRQLLDEFNRERSAAMRVGQEAPLLKLTVEKGKPCPCSRQLDKIRINPVAPLDQQAGRLPPFPQCPQRCSFCHITPTEYIPKGPGLISRMTSGLGRTIAFLIKAAVLLGLIGGLGYALWIYQPWKKIPEDINVPLVSDYLNSDQKSNESDAVDKNRPDVADKDNVKGDDKDADTNTDAQHESVTSEPKIEESPTAEESRDADKDDRKSGNKENSKETNAEEIIPEGYRVWTDENGNQIVGKFVKLYTGKAFVQEYKTEEIVKIPIKNLTDEDKDYIRPLVKKNREK